MQVVHIWSLLRKLSIFGPIQLVVILEKPSGGLARVLFIILHIDFKIYIILQFTTTCWCVHCIITVKLQTIIVQTWGLKKLRSKGTYCIIELKTPSFLSAFKYW